MRALILGVGLQGRAVVYDLVHHGDGIDVLAADVSPAAAGQRLAALGLDVPVMALDAARPESVAAILSEARPDVVVCMVPPALGPTVARAAIEGGAHFVSSSYAGDLVELHELARERGVTLLPEMGMDPGIDLLLCQIALEGLDEVTSLESFGGGIPDPASARDNPLGYKVTWSLDGVLAAYLRPARLMRRGKVETLDGAAIFERKHLLTERFSVLGALEAYPNGDALRYVDLFGLGPELETMGRYALRWPGHAAAWRTLVGLGLLDEAPTLGGAAALSPRQLMVEHLGPRLAYGDRDRDVVVLRARARGSIDGRRTTRVVDLLDSRDLDTGLFAMSRTVGFTASVAAQLVLKGRLAGPGLLSPARDVDPHLVLEELERRGIRVDRRLDEPRPV